MRDTTTPPKKTKRPRNQPAESEKETKGPKRSRHDNGDESDTSSPNNGSGTDVSRFVQQQMHQPAVPAPIPAEATGEISLEQLLTQMKEMQSMFRSELFLLRQQLRQQNTDQMLASERLTRKMNALQKRVDQLLKQQQPQQQTEENLVTGAAVAQNTAAPVEVRTVATTAQVNPVATQNSAPTQSAGARKSTALPMTAGRKKTNTASNATTAAAAARTKIHTAASSTAREKSAPPATLLSPPTLPPIIPENDRREAVLMESPKDLFALWDEYDKGINGAKPVKLFTFAERNNPKVKQTHYRRRVFWETVSMMIQPQRGYSVESAIEAIYKEYADSRGHACSVTKILIAMIQRRTAKKIEIFGKEGKGKSKKSAEEMAAAENTIEAAAIPIGTAAATATTTMTTTGATVNTTKPSAAAKRTAKNTRSPTVATAPKTTFVPPVRLTPFNDTRPATLSERPKNLYALWEEYQIGINGSKPAKTFTTKDRRGKVKQTYYRRKVFWDAVSKMLQEQDGWTAKDAIEAIYKEYDCDRKLAVTSILQAMIRKRGESRKEEEEEKSTS